MKSMIIFVLLIIGVISDSPPKYDQQVVYFGQNNTIEYYGNRMYCFESVSNVIYNISIYDNGREVYTQLNTPNCKFCGFDGPCNDHNYQVVLFSRTTVNQPYEYTIVNYRWRDSGCSVFTFFKWIAIIIGIVIALCAAAIICRVIYLICEKLYELTCRSIVKFRNWQHLRKQDKKHNAMEMQAINCN